MATQARATQAAVDIREVGLRDGLQIERPISTAAKVRLLEALIDTGVRRIEATAFVSPKAVPAMADADAVAAHVATLQERHPGIVFSALVPNVRGAERAIAAGITNLEYVVSAADGHSEANTRQSTAQAVQATSGIVRAAHRAGGRCEMIVATAWDCPFDGPTPVDRTVEVCARAVEAGVDQLCLADTIGTSVPGRVVDLIDAVSCVTEGVPLGAHFHNTRGTGIACAWAAMSAGVVMLDASVGGLGGCPFAPGASGNVATEELVYLFEHSGVHTGLDLEAVLAAATLVGELVGHEAGGNLLKAGGPSRARNNADVDLHSGDKSPHSADCSALSSALA